MEKQFVPHGGNVQEKLRLVKANIEGVIKGKGKTVDLALVTLIAGGHLLLEDIPGVGKTMLAIALARSVDCSFRRIQFTNDTIPADILGANVYSRQEERFKFIEGPIFAGVVLADEINRTSPKTQSALLEAMTERQISMENKVYPLPNPFMVIATQNPIEHHGAFPLPESQLDRFLIRLMPGYPDRNAEREILKQNISPKAARLIDPVITPKEILQAKKEVLQVRFDESLYEFLLDIVERTRNDQRLLLGASPRGALMLKRAAQANAYYHGRDFALPDDIKSLVTPVLGHRIILKGKGEAASERALEAILDSILQTVAAPV